MLNERNNNAFVQKNYFYFCCFVVRRVSANSTYNEKGYKERGKGTKNLGLQICPSL